MNVEHSRKRFRAIAAKLGAAWQDYARAQLVIQQCMLEIGEILEDIAHNRTG